MVVTIFLSYWGREEWWMKELKTLYPYGLNDKCGNTYYSDYQKDRLVFAVFNKQVITRHQKGSKKKENSFVKSDALIQKFVLNMNKLIKTDGNWRRYCVSFLTSVSLEVLNALKSEIEILSNVINGNKNVSDFISHLINYRCKNNPKKIS